MTILLDISAIAAIIESFEHPHQSLEQPMVTLSDAQYNQLLAMLSARLLGSSLSPSTRGAFSGTVTTGMCDDHGMTLVNTLTPIWLMDSGASRHICANLSIFTTFKPLHNSMVTLPNHTSLPASFSGDVMINDYLILRDALYMPGFKFNLDRLCQCSYSQPVPCGFVFRLWISHPGYQQQKDDWQG